MVVRRQRFSSQVHPELLSAMREIARAEGRHLAAVLEDAMRDYVEKRKKGKIRPEAMAHYQASLEINRKLYELLAH